MAAKKNFQKVEAQVTEVKEEVYMGTQAVAQKNDGDAIWEEIKDLTVSIFALPGQRVSSYASKMIGTPNFLLVNVKTGAAVPAIEEAIGKKYVLSVEDRHVRITRAAE